MQVARLYHRLCKKNFGKPVLEKQDCVEELPKMFANLPWEDLWEDAGMVSVLQYLRGNKSLCLPQEWREAFPSQL